MQPARVAAQAWRAVVVTDVIFDTGSYVPCSGALDSRGGLMTAIRAALWHYESTIEDLRAPSPSPHASPCLGGARARFLLSRHD